MCSEHSPSKLKNSSFILYFLAISLGIFCGYSEIPFLHNVAHYISEIFIKIFKCISLPIISLSIIVTLSKKNEDRSLDSIWKKTFLYTLSTTIVAASIACLLYLIIDPHHTTTTSAPNNTLYNANSTQYFDHLLNLIPSNIFEPFLQHQVLGVLLISIVIGYAIAHLRENEAKTHIIATVRGIHAIFMQLTSWTVKMIPVALFGFITTTILQIQGGVTLYGLTKYLLIVLLANLVQGFIFLPILLKSHKIPVIETMKRSLNALSLAFFSKSSSGTLPVTINVAENKLQVSPKIAKFTLPLCTAINMNGCAAFIFTTVIYVMQNQGIVITPFTMISWIFIATIAAVGNAGVPMGCFFLSASLLTSMNIPIELLGFILPFYSLIDMVETSLNVWSDLCITKIIDSSQKNI